MVFNEIQLLGVPSVTIACGVEYDKYKNRFKCPKDYLELSICEEGRIVFEYPDGKREITEPEMLIPIFSDTECRSYAYEGEKQKHTTVAVNVPYTYKRYENEAECDISALRERLKNNCTILIPYHYGMGQAYSETLYSLKKICVNTYSEAPGGRVRALAEWYRLVSFLTDTVFSKLSEARLNTSPSELVYADKAERFIALSYMNRVSVADVARHVGISEGYLYRIFRRVKGIGVTEYLNRYRVSVAAELMSGKGLSLKEAAFNVGVEDPAYMSRLFKKVTGLSCREYLGNKRTKRF
jgi:AraC-like DNA-binding protein